MDQGPNVLRPIGPSEAQPGPGPKWAQAEVSPGPSGPGPKWPWAQVTAAVTEEFPALACRPSLHAGMPRFRYCPTRASPPFRLTAAVAPLRFLALVLLPLGPPLFRVSASFLHPSTYLFYLHWGPVCITDFY